MRVSGKQDFSYEQRLQLDGYLKEGFQKKHIAELLGVCLATVYNEIKRGLRNGIYDPDYSQERYMQLKTVRGKQEKLFSDTKLAQQIADLILNEKLSPEKAIIKLRQQNIDCPTKTTIYSAIDKGLIPKVTRESLQNKRTTIFSNGLIQIPLWVRKKLCLQDGDSISIDIENKSIILEKI